jgi:uncharacterized protein (TIGR02099 family)
LNNPSGLHTPELSPDSRRALYYRLHGLRALLGRPLVARGLRLAGWLMLAGWLLFVALVLVLRFVILPAVGDYRADIERVASQAVGQPVRIQRVEAHWRGLNPELVLDGVSLLDAAGVPALSLERIETVLSWHSLWQFQPVLALLSFERPVLHVRRDTGGRISIAGMASDEGGDPAFAEWVLDQLRIRVHDATIVWEDAMRGAPPLVLEDLQFGLDNSGRRHRFGLSALPPAALSARIDLRGEVFGEVHEALERFSGKLYLEVDHADLAGWQQWVDYPVDLPRGRGGLRLWGTLAEGEGKLTADLSLADLRIRLGEKLPAFDLAVMSGRLGGEYRPDAWALTAQQLELQTSDGIRLAPTDFHLDWRTMPDGIKGNMRANQLDLDVLAHLAGHLPLDARSRELLLAYAPRGRVSDLRASWGLQGEKLTRYSLSAGFSGLGVSARSYFPGADGLAGSIDLSEKGGRLQIDSAKSALALPAVFPEPDIAFDVLKARVGWKNTAAALDVAIEQVEFSGPDATGKAHGKYRYSGDGPGEIDLEASIERANGNAVWRYMPHAVNADARQWLRHGITGGTAHDARLVLNGNLRDFPFRDPATGKFLVTAKARDARIDYADGWPVIEGVSGDMSFDFGMRVHATAGRILGAELPDVTVSIPDFDVDDEVLLVRGAATGPTNEFLDFIERSPVAESIDRFTEGMRAVGNGRLDLELDIPLRRPLETRMRGAYHFHDNQVHLVEGLPMIGQVNGRLDLTDSSILATEITGRGFGGPLRVKVGSEGGKVLVSAAGTASVTEVASHFGWPLLDRLSGSTPWKADLVIHRRNAYVLVTSDLLGISSPLPDLLNKAATSRLPLRIERTAPTPDSEQYRITLGEVARGMIQRQNGKWTRGVFALGTAEAVLPASGLDVRVAMPSIDADAWRNHLPDDGAAGEAGAEAASALALSSVSLRTPVLRLFGSDYHEVELGLTPQGASWKIDLKTRESAGTLVWRSADDGWVEGRLQRLHLPQSIGQRAASPSVIDSLPGMNLQVDDLRLGSKQLGQLELRARNLRGAWMLEKLRLNNPDGELAGSGRWTHGLRQRTDLDFELNTGDIGKLLTRLGYEDAVRQGKARLAGSLRWNGPLTDLHYPSLSGELDVKAEKGQFNKLEPGVGRLLGLISLQSLPRRLTLDFRDLFSEGLAFDSIEGKLAVEGGVMNTLTPLVINGPAVQVAIEGRTDLQKETQDLLVGVRPEVSTLAIGAAALVNPVAGAAALVANTLLKSPLNRVFSYRYHVTGSWSDPQVEKLGLGEEKPPAAAQEQKP